MTKFASLHNHSYYSFLFGVPSPEDIVAKAAKQGLKACAITDFGGMYGVLEFYTACKKKGIKPILGTELFIAPRSRHDKTTRADGRPDNIVLLAENTNGYININHLCNIAHLEGMYYKPRIDYEVLSKYKEGIIALDSGTQTRLGKMIEQGASQEELEKVAVYHKELFGENNYYLCLLPHDQTPVQLEINVKFKNLSAKLNIPLAVTYSSLYLNSSDAEAQDVLVCIGLGRDITDQSRLSMMDEDYSMREVEEIEDYFSDEQEAIENTGRIAERCSVVLDLGSYHIPDFISPDYTEPIKYFRTLCIKGLKNRYPEFAVYISQIKWHDISQSVIDLRLVPLDTKDKRDDDIGSEKEKDYSGGHRIAIRFEYEFKIIQKMGFESYYLMVSDYVTWAKANKILVGPGRGSGAGSIIAYALDITDLDPLKYGLLFERFLNPERVSMPDFDVDFSDLRRDEVIEYVRNKYGSDRVAQISTFGTLSAKAAIKDVGRTYGIPFADMNAYSKLIPDRPGTTLDEAWEQEESLRNLTTSNPKLQKVWDTAKKLEGTVRHISVHACAVVIADKSLENYTPIQHPPKDDATIITQFSAKPLEKLGLLKMDFLGLKNLSILEKAIDLIKLSTGVSIDINAIPMDDVLTFELFQAGNTTGIFQFESSGMKRYLKELKPTRFEDLIAMNSLYRPGPMEFIPKYIEGKFNPNKVEYPHSSLKPILEETYGIAVYQEQVLQIAQIFAGYSLGQADILRRAIGKKIAEEMAAQRTTFIDGAVRLGNDKGLAEHIFDDVVVPFAGYGFNKSHAAAYGMIAYQTAYLKAHYASQFMASLLTSDKQNIDRIAIEIDECNHMGIEVLSPDVNESYNEFTVLPDSKIRFGLSAIKNLGESCIEAIIQARGNKFANIEEFLSKIPSTLLNKKNLEALIKSGAMDSLCSREEAITSIEEMSFFAKERQKANTIGQLDLFSIMEDNLAGFEFRGKAIITIEQKLDWEKEFLGLFVSMHPLAGLEKLLKLKTQDLSKVDEEFLKKHNSNKFCGLISNPKIIKTKNQENFASFTLETQQGKLEVVAFPSVYSRCRNAIQDGKVVIIDGILKLRNSQLQLNAENVALVEINTLRVEAESQNLLGLGKRFYPENPEIPVLTGKLAPSNLWQIHIPYFASQESLEVLKQILIRNPGDQDVEIILPNGKIIQPKSKVCASDQVRSEVIRLWTTEL